MKKEYQKPTMKVYEVKMSQIICQSGGGEEPTRKRAKDWDGEFGYIPGLTTEEHLA